MDKDRYERGMRKLKEIDGEAGEKVIESLNDIAPDLARYTIEFPFGDIYSRPGLDLKSREIAEIAALTALGNAAPQLKVHIHGALNVGVPVKKLLKLSFRWQSMQDFPQRLTV
jgi:4-carboxymuconolactone decarboxylase